MRRTTLRNCFTQTDPQPYGAGTSFEGAYVYGGGRPTVMTDPGGMRFSDDPVAADNLANADPTGLALTAASGGAPRPGPGSSRIGFAGTVPVGEQELHVEVFPPSISTRSIWVANMVGVPFFLGSTSGGGFPQISYAMSWMKVSGSPPSANVQLSVSCRMVSSRAITGSLCPGPSVLDENFNMKLGGTRSGDLTKAGTGGLTRNFAMNLNRYAVFYFEMYFKAGNATADKTARFCMYRSNSRNGGSMFKVSGSYCGI
jgi:hypothetical protein